MTVRPRKVSVIPAQPVSGTVLTTPNGDSIQIVTEVYGEPSFFEGHDTTTPGATSILVAIFGVTAPTIRYLTAVRVSSCVDGKFEALLNGDIIASGYTRPGKTEADYPWPAARPLAATDAFEVVFTAAAWTPAGADVDAYLVVGDLSP